jgi:outer membrane protein OmpA-like peptidoglycan-associated protein
LAFFPASQADLRSEDKQRLEKVADFLKSQPNLVINLVGHSDHRGDQPDNDKLSNLRALTVARQLAELGVDKKQINVQEGVISYAERSSVPELQLDRRVDMTITMTAH